MIIDEANRRIEASIPLTSHAGKIRVKTRRTHYEYGEFFKSRQSIFTLDNYIEWQISYDAGETPSRHAAITYDRGGGGEKILD